MGGRERRGTVHGQTRNERKREVQAERIWARER